MIVSQATNGGAIWGREKRGQISASGADTLGGRRVRHNRRLFETHRICDHTWARSYEPLHYFLFEGLAAFLLPCLTFLSFLSFFWLLLPLPMFFLPS